MNIDIDNIINTTLNSFDFALVISINILTYIIIRIIDDINGKKDVNSWIKRLAMIISCIIISIIYSICDFCDKKLILNSVILAPVFWSWLGKPIMKKFGIDYKDIANKDK